MGNYRSIQNINKLIKRYVIIVTSITNTNGSAIGDNIIYKKNILNKNYVKLGYISLVYD